MLHRMLVVGTYHDAAHQLVFNSVQLIQSFSENTININKKHNIIMFVLFLF